MSTPIRIALYSRRVLLPDGLKEATVVVEGGKIAGILRGRSQDYYWPLEDFGDLVIMPGLIDPHVHINEPGRTHWEGFNTATAAALASGITMLIEMPLNASPVTTTVQAFETKKHAATGNLHTNCGFWGGITPGNSGEIEPLVQSGVKGFKAFLAPSGIDEFPQVTEDDLRLAMPVISAHHLPLLVHSELPAPLADKLSSDARSYQRYLQSRPGSWEDSAIALMIGLCETYNCHVHIVHLSSAASLPQIKAAKSKGLPLTVETAQHYLFFSAEEITDGDTRFKCAPPIRSKANNEKLWQALKDGLIDFVATDHSPAPPELKEMESGDFTKAWGGISSLQFALPALWTSALMHGCEIPQISEWLSAAPARLAGLANTKGRIAAGFDADLVIWDPDESFTVSSEMIVHRHKITPYLGHRLKGLVKQTWLMGERVFDDGRLCLPFQGKVI